MIFISIIITFIYFLFILTMIVGFYKASKEKEIDNNSLEKISVVVALRNEQENINNLLKTIESLSYPKEFFEVILINDNSEDKTEMYIYDYIINSELNISYYNLIDKKSKKEALKLGVSKSKYNIIATTDADCLLPNNWLKLISNRYSNERHMLIGPVMFNNTKGVLGAFQILDMLAIQGVQLGMAYFDKPVLNNGANLCFNKKTFLNVEGYDKYKTPSGDDVFLLEKFIKEPDVKIKGVLEKQYIVITKHENKLTNFINQRLRWGSKSNYYKNNYLRGVSLIVFLENVLQLFIYTCLLLVDKFFIIWLILLLSKWLIDLILLILASSFFDRKRYLNYFVPMQLIYPIYIVFIAILSKLIKFEWKGRVYR